MIAKSRYIIMFFNYFPFTTWALIFVSLSISTSSTVPLRIFNV